MLHSSLKKEKTRPECMDVIQVEPGDLAGTDLLHLGHEMLKKALNTSPSGTLSLYITCVCLFNFLCLTKHSLFQGQERTVLNLKLNTTKVVPYV